MTLIQQAPTPQGGARAKTTNTICYKGSEIIVTPMGKKLFDILETGHKYSSFQLMRLLKTSDPRKEVQRLRNNGVNVCDEWIAATKEAPRHKQYFINPLECV